MPKGTLLLFTSIAVVGLLAGCGKQLTGRYEAMPDIPQTRIPGAVPKLQKQLDAQMRQLQEMGRMILEFDGSKVRFGTSVAISEYRYQVNGNRLELIADAMGQKTIVPMTIEADGSITYQTFRFRRVR
jgi:hypothetical protein